MSNTLFVGAAFAVTWVVIIGYALHLRRSIQRSRELLDRSARGDR
jgi:CcmD family protein